MITATESVHAADVPEMQQALSPAQAAAILGCSEQTIRRWVSAGQIPSFKIGQARRVRRDVIEAIMDPTCRVQPRPGDWHSADEYIALMRPDR